VASGFRAAAAKAGGLVPAEAHQWVYHLTPVLIRKTSARLETDTEIR
jgi:hypothetical protein